MYVSVPQETGSCVRRPTGTAILSESETLPFSVRAGLAVGEGPRQKATGVKLQRAVVPCRKLVIGQHYASERRGAYPGQRVPCVGVCEKETKKNTDSTPKSDQRICARVPPDMGTILAGHFRPKFPVRRRRMRRGYLSLMKDPWTWNCSSSSILCISTR